MTYFTLYRLSGHTTLWGWCPGLVILPDGLDELLAFARVVDGLDTGHRALDALLVVHLEHYTEHMKVRGACDMGGCHGFMTWWLFQGSPNQERLPTCSLLTRKRKNHWLKVASLKIASYSAVISASPPVHEINVRTSGTMRERRE